VDVIVATPPDQFRPSDLPLLTRYCELVALADRAAAELRDGNPVTTDRVGELSIADSAVSWRLVIEVIWHSFALLSWPDHP